MKTLVSSTIDPHVENALVAYAERVNTSRSGVIRMAIESFLADLIVPPEPPLPPVIREPVRSNKPFGRFMKLLPDDPDAVDIRERSRATGRSVQRLTEELEIQRFGKCIPRRLKGVLS